MTLIINLMRGATATVHGATFTESAIRNPQSAIEDSAIRLRD